MGSLSTDGLDPALVDFITSGISIHVAGVGEHLKPAITRALGCRVDADSRRITLLLPKSRCRALQEALAKNRQIAAVFSRPEDNRTVQLKGSDAELGDASESDVASLPGYSRRFSERVERFNIPEIFIHTFFSCDPGDLLTVTFTPTSSFEQTPGNRAGERLPLAKTAP